jgi:tetratricopeptide (TPR) repeat protein/TolB-like protein
MTREVRGALPRGGLILVGVIVLALGVPGAAAVKPRAVVVVPFAASGLEAQQQWMGEGIAQILSLGLAQHPAFILLERARLRTFGRPEAWGEAVVVQAAKGIRADAALFGQLVRSGSDLVVQPRLLEMKASGPETVSLEPITVTEVDLLARLASLPVTYARTLKVPLTEGEAARMERASRPTQSLRAFELFARGQAAGQRGGQEGNEAAVDLLTKAIEADPTFAVAQYTLGTVHQALGNRWKAAAQFRASTQLDDKYPEPYKALGDLLLAAPRRLFDQAVEAYGKAIELRPFYADAHVGLGDARAAKGDIDGAINAYQKALVFNPVNPRVHMSLGKIYYTEKGLYYESVNAYKKAIDLDPQSVEARMGLGEVYEDKGLYKEAIEEYRKVIDADAKHTGALYNLALVYEKVDPRESIVLWERYIVLASQVPSEKDWVDVARQHLRKLKSQIKE